MVDDLALRGLDKREVQHYLADMLTAEDIDQIIAERDRRHREENEDLRQQNETVQQQNENLQHRVSTLRNSLLDLLSSHSDASSPEVTIPKELIEKILKMDESRSEAK